MKLRLLKQLRESESGFYQDFGDDWGVLDHHSAPIINSPQLEDITLTKSWLQTLLIEMIDRGLKVKLIQGLPLDPSPKKC